MCQVNFHKPFQAHKYAEYTEDFQESFGIGRVSTIL